MTASREKAEAELLRYHPDFEDIRETDDFHNWVEEQPKSIQDALYENNNDAIQSAGHSSHSSHGSHGSHSSHSSGY